MTTVIEVSAKFQSGCGGENVPSIPGACATRNFTYLVRGPSNLALGTGSSNELQGIDMMDQHEIDFRFIWHLSGSKSHLTAIGTLNAIILLFQAILNKSRNQNVYVNFNG